MGMNRRHFLATATSAVVSTFLPNTALADYRVPRDAIWFHVNNLQHRGAMVRALRNDTRPADVGDRILRNPNGYWQHQSLTTSVVYAYNLKHVPSDVKAWHQPQGGDLNPFMLPTQDPATFRGYGRAPTLAGQRAEAAWVFQTAGEIATLELKLNDLVRDDDVQKGTYFVICKTAGPKLMFPGGPQGNYALHVTSSMLKWHTRRSAPRRVVLPRSFE